jgi:CBS domain-containing protein
MSTTVKDVMTTRVVSVNKCVSFKEIAASLKRYRVSGFPVIDDDRTVLGVVSATDLLTKEALQADPGREPRPVSGERHYKDRSKFGALTAADLMTSPAVTVLADESVAHAARLMYTSQVMRLPVVDAGNHLVGIVSRTDVLSVYDRTDTDIRQEIEDSVILGKCHNDPARFVVIVSNGIVTLEGHPETNSDGHEIAAAAWHVEGVVAVRDRMAYSPATQVIRTGPLS